MILKKNQNLNLQNVMKNESFDNAKLESTKCYKNFNHCHCQDHHDHPAKGYRSIVVRSANSQIPLHRGAHQQEN